MLALTLCYFNHQSSISAKNRKVLQIKEQTFLPQVPGNCRPYKAEPALPTVCSDKSITSTGMLNISGRRDRCEAVVEFDQAVSQPSVHYRTSQQEHTLPVSIPQPEERYSLSLASPVCHQTSMFTVLPNALFGLIMLFCLSVFWVFIWDHPFMSLCLFLPSDGRLFFF